MNNANVQRVYFLNCARQYLSSTGDARLSSGPVRKGLNI